MHATHHLNNWQHELLTQQGSMRCFVGPSDVAPLVDTRGKSPEAPTTLKAFKA